MTQLRPYIVIIFGSLLGISLIISTFRLLFAPAKMHSKLTEHRIAAFARLTLGVSLVLLALLLFLGQTLWQGDGTSTAPAWAVPFGVLAIGAFLLSAAIMGGVAVVRRLRASP